MAMTNDGDFLNASYDIDGIMHSTMNGDGTEKNEGSEVTQPNTSSSSKSDAVSSVSSGVPLQLQTLVFRVARIKALLYDGNLQLPSSPEKSNKTHETFSTTGTASFIQHFLPMMSNRTRQHIITINIPTMTI